ncbi:hypothetical protein C0995_005664 [Termitomyces sp. Mi166|nr:hypothetical protein C0995_005664 [Termitomyces sp. Mi166\
MLPIVFITFLIAVFVTGGVSTPAIVPFYTQADVAIIQNPNGDGDTRVYYQPSSGTIAEYSLTGPFDVGNIFDKPGFVVVPATETHPGTPIAAAVLGPSFKEESPVIAS